MRKRVFIIGPDFGCDHTFKKAGFQTVDNPDMADFLVLTGGQDINPALYGEKPLRGVHFTERRDAMEVAFWNKYKTKKAFLGICRGAQLLCVLNGGRLWQDVNNHAGSRHHVWDHRKKESFSVNSVHHQMMRPSKAAEIIATATVSTRRDAEKESESGLSADDPEVIFHRETLALGFQGHPEFGYPPATEYFFNLVRDLY